MVAWVLTPIAQEHVRQRGLDVFDVLGFLPDMINDGSPDSAVQQFHRNYQHGGGWHRFHGHKLTTFAGKPALQYPGDPPQPAIAEATLRDEQIVLFQGSWVAVIQKDGSFEVARMD